MVFDEALLRAVATDAGAAEAALDRLVEADLIQQVEHGREGNRYRFTHALVHEAVYQNLLLSRRTELHERAGRALERATGPHPERLSDLEALGHHWSLSPDKRKGARYLVAAGDWARAVYANEDAIRHYERALRTLADCQDCDDQVQAVRERLADLLALTGRRAEALAHYEAVRQELEAAADRAGAARLHRKIGGLHWEAGDRERASACFASGLERLGEDGNPIERAQLFQEIGRLAFRAGDNAGAIAWAERALAEAASEEETATDPERAREAAATRAQAYNTLGVALARTGRLGEAVDQIEQSIGLAESARSAAGGLPRLHEPRRALQLARPAPQHRDLPPRARDGEEGRRSRLPVAALCQPRRGLLRADRPVRGGRRRGGAKGRRPRPSTGAARSPGGAADRLGPDPPVPRRPCPGLRVLSRRRWVWPSGSESRSSSSPATMASLRSISMPGTRLWPRSTWRSRRRCASAPGSSPTPSWFCRFSVSS